jgi:PAS domain S-box-containing protein
VEDSALLAALARKTTTGAELVRHPKTRELRYLQYTAAPVRSGGRMVGAVAPDVTDQRKAEEAKRESEERFRIMADSAPIPIWVTDAEGLTLFVNQASCEHFCVRQEEVQEGRWRRLLHPEDAPGYLAASAVAIREHAPFRAEARFRRVDGEWRWMASRAVPRFSPRGEFLGHVGASPDITDSTVALSKPRAWAPGLALASPSEFPPRIEQPIREKARSVAPSPGACAGRLSTRRRLSPRRRRGAMARLPAGR